MRQFALIACKFGDLLVEFGSLKNDELAIAAYKLALQVYKRDTFPEQWAKTQCNLANAYKNCKQGGWSKSYEQAIAAYEEALQVYIRDTFPEKWADTQRLIAHAYSNLALIYKLECPESYDKIISAYEKAIEANSFAQRVYSYSTSREKWAGIRDIIAVDKEQEIFAYEKALQIYTRDVYPEKWAELQSQLAIAYRCRIRGDSAENCERAIAIYGEVLQIYRRDQFPEKWADTQFSLAIAYRLRQRGNRAENLEQAIAIWEQVLQVHTLEAFPEKWANAQFNLAYEYKHRIRGEKAENIEREIAAHKQSLQGYTPACLKWARTQHRLARAYNERIRGERSENIEHEIAAYEKSLLTFTRNTFPEDWAQTQYELSICYKKRIRGELVENLEQSIAAYELALQFFKNDASSAADATPENLAMVYCNLANDYKNLAIAYQRRIRGEPAENIKRAESACELAISACEQPLQVYTCNNFPIQWANVQHILAVVYRNRTSGDRIENIELAIAASKKALQVYPHDDFPEQWATMQYNLAVIYSESNWVQNLEDSIKTFRLALEVRTPEFLPMESLQTAYSLGNLGFNNNLPEIAIEGYSMSIVALEKLRSQFFDLFRNEDIISQAIEVYANLVQVYIDLSESAKALEICDRFKTVELLIIREIYPQGDIPPEIITELDRKRRAIAIAEEKLNQLVNDSSQF
ncbi:MAG: hypothetical protein DCF19_07480 [Pseudanabaena frigida]|uniref:Tetratricopeptide repeat protein n=1 Tax=Pseudanabaena frigida TaxID=945775 RepID=A0A2W4Y4N5_9CYAN|nr:MAG: hypothetical protein DCF19_07480 [Pseudanabaena frigida]